MLQQTYINLVTYFVTKHKVRSTIGDFIPFSQTRCMFILIVVREENQACVPVIWYLNPHNDREEKQAWAPVIWYLDPHNDREEKQAWAPVIRYLNGISAICQSKVIKVVLSR